MARLLTSGLLAAWWQSCVTVYRCSLARVTLIRCALLPTSINSMLAFSAVHHDCCADVVTVVPHCAMLGQAEQSHDGNYAQEPIVRRGAGTSYARLLPLFPCVAMYILGMVILDQLFTKAVCACAQRTGARVDPARSRSTRVAAPVRFAHGVVTAAKHS